MAVITPNINPSQSLIPVGFPLVSIAKSNPLSTMISSAQAPETPDTNGTGVAQSQKLQAAIVQAGDQNNQSV